MTTAVLVITLCEAILLLAFVLYLVRKYAQTELPLLVKGLTVIGWFLGFAVILTVPADIQIAQDTGESSHILKGWYYFSYWSSYLLNYLILPYLTEYIEAGEFTRKGKLMRSLKRNLPYYLLYIVLFIALVVVLMSTQVGQEAIKQDGLVGCLIGLGLVIGLLSVIILIGYGLVEVPKRCF